ncbi:MAG: GNAT family N-acetyltransferase [Oscillospiraceae bacterium]
MRYIINGKEYTYLNNINNNKEVCKSFNELLEQTFGLTFESWEDEYIPHVLLHDNHVVANVSVNIIHTVWDKQKKLYIQLGTVMTKMDYRNQGLSRFLIEKILEEWKPKCDAIYLFANDSVLKFYPKFGFVQENEYQYEMEITPQISSVRKLYMSNKSDIQLLVKTYEKSNPFSALPMENNIGLIMFYCSQFMKDSVYYIAEYDGIVIADYDDETMICYDIFCDQDISMEQIISIVAKQNIKIVKLGFTPKLTHDYKNSLLKEDDTTLFVLAQKENIFANNKLMFSILSHA